MARRSRAKAGTPGEPNAPVEAAVGARVPAPLEERAARSPLAAATGTDHLALQHALLNDLVATLGVAPGTEAFERRGPAAFALLSAFAPRDAIEGVMAAQFAAMHVAGMAALRRATCPELPPEVSSRLRRDAASLFRAVNETAQAIEARRGGAVKQVVRVERVVIQDGGQAVVGAIAGQGRGS